MSIVRVGLLVVVCLLATACGQVRVKPEYYHHMICANSDGDAASLMVEGDTARRETPMPQHVNDIAESYWYYCINQKKLPSELPITLVIHGGLVSMSESVREAQDVVEDILRSGSYPLFVNWETGMLRSYFDHLFSIRRGRRNLWMSIPTSPIVFAMDVGGALVRLLPSLFLEETVNSLGAYHAIPQAVPVGWTESAWIDTRNQDKGYSSGLWRFTREVVPGAARLITTPLLDAIGRSAYYNMLRRARVLFLRDEDFDRGHHQLSGALALLMQRLLDPSGFKESSLAWIIRNMEIQSATTTDEGEREDLQSRITIARRIRDSNEHGFENLPFQNIAEPTFTIVAHSLGTLVANELIRRYGSEATFQRIVYMGAACSIKQFADEALPYVAANKDCRFYNLCLHPLDEIGEWSAYGTAPHGSLLVWIDSYLTETKTELDFTLGRWDNIMRALPIVDQLTADIRERIVIRGFGRNKAFPQSHGQFNDKKMAYWLEPRWDHRKDPRTQDQAMKSILASRESVNSDTIARSLKLRELEKAIAKALAHAESTEWVEVLVDDYRHRLPQIAPNVRKPEKLVEIIQTQAEARHRALGGHGQLGVIRPRSDTSLLVNGVATFEIINTTQQTKIETACKTNGWEVCLEGQVKCGDDLVHTVKLTRTDAAAASQSQIDLRFTLHPTEPRGTPSAHRVQLQIIQSPVVVDRSSILIDDKPWQAANLWAPGTKLRLVLVHPIPVRVLRPWVEKAYVGEGSDRIDLTVQVEQGALIIENKSTKILQPDQIRTSPLEIQLSEAPVTIRSS
jgi:hypothetical protein